MDNFAYRQFFSADLTKLPDEVLKSIYHTVRIELEKRRGSVIICKKSQNEFNTDPHIRRVYSKHKHKYLDQLLQQDWSFLFKGYDEEKKYYVYVHHYPNGKSCKFLSEKIKLNINGLPFYVGKGCGDRAYDLKRNQGHGEVLKQLLAKGYASNDFVSIVKSSLTEAEALELESKLIYFFGTKYESHRVGILVNLDIPPRPENFI